MTQSTAVTDAFFLKAASGQRFCLFHTPARAQETLGSLVYIHPFADEMNGSRRMVALQSRAFANAGFAVLQIDLLGCGDSSGTFENASWSAWVEDVVMARHWLASRTQGPSWLWGLRAGCLLAAQVAKFETIPANLLLWQPVLSGRQHLNQFLRLQMAADIARGVRGAATASLAQQLTQGQAVEVAGYSISPPLAQGLELADLEGINARSEVTSFELSNTASDGISPALNAQMLRWQGAGCKVTVGAIEGPAFWQTLDSQTCPALIDASLTALVTAAAGGRP